MFYACLNQIHLDFKHYLLQKIVEISLKRKNPDILQKEFLSLFILFKLKRGKTESRKSDHSLHALAIE